MKLTALELKGLFLIEPDVFKDARGSFGEIYSKEVFKKNGIEEKFVQDNVSRSSGGTLRGLHYQLEPHAQGKLVYVPSGEVFDCAIDIRRGSPTFGQWYGTRLSSTNSRALYIPAGFAHGFMALSAVACLIYKCTDYYVPETARHIIWNDPTINIKWPDVPDQNLISEKDRQAPRLELAEINFTYTAKEDR